MTCLHITQLLSDSLDAPLSPPERAEVDAHLTGCPSCVQALKDLVVVTGTLHGFPAVEAEESLATPALPEALVTRIVAARAASGLDQGRRVG